MPKQTLSFLSLLLVLLLLVACGGKEEEAAAPTAVADPTAGFREVNSDAIGVSIRYPGDWVTQIGAEGDIQLASDAVLLSEQASDFFKGAIMAITSIDHELLTFLDDTVNVSDPVSVLNVLTTLVTEDDNVTFTNTQAAAATTVAGKSAASTTFSVTGRDGKGTAYLTAVLDGPRTVFIFAAAEESITSFAATHSAMLSTLRLVTPTASAPAAEAVAAAPAPTTPPQPTPTPLPQPTPTPEPTPEPTPAFSYVSIDVEPGFYVYTSGDFIRNMALYDGKVWVASLGGVLAWDANSGESRKYTTLDGLPHIGVYGITACPVPEMTLLAGTENGLAAYDPASDSWYLATHVFQTEPVTGLFGVSGQDVGAILCDAANNRLILEYKGVTIVNLADGSKRNVPGSELSWSGVRRLTLVGNQLWVSSGYRGYTIIDDAGVRPFSKNAGTFAADTIYHIAAAPNGDIWMAASEGLLQVRNNQVVNTFNRDNTPNFSTPYYVAFAPGGEMWVGMSSRLCQFDPASRECRQNFTATQVPGMPSGEVSNILFDTAGNLYYHVFEGGWGYYNGAQWQFFRDNELPIHAVQTLFDDGQGHIWMLGGTAYTLRTDLEMKQGWERIRDMGGDDITTDANGNIWLATGRNLYQFDGFQITRRQTADGLLDSYARTVAVGNDGRVWVGQENGLSIWNGQQFTTLTTANDNWPEGRIYALLLDGDVVWAGTDKGLIRYADGRAELVLHKDVVGLPSPSITALAKLPDGRLLVGTGGGLVYYDHAQRSLKAEMEVTAAITDLAVSPEGEIFAASAADLGGGLYIRDDLGWLHLTTANGLLTNRLRTLLLDSAGTLWVGGGYWGSGGGLMRFVPERP